MKTKLKNLIESKKSDTVAVVKFNQIVDGTLYTSYEHIAVVDGQAEFRKNITLGDELRGDDARNAVADKCILTGTIIYDWNNGRVLSDRTIIVEDVTFYENKELFEKDQWGGEWDDVVCPLDEVAEYGNNNQKALIKAHNN